MKYEKKVMYALAALVCVVSSTACSVSQNQAPTAINAGSYLTADMPRCGPAIARAEVLVVDTEGAEMLSPELAGRIGPFELADERPLYISARKDERDSTAKALEIVARQGCDLLLIGGVVDDTRLIGDGLYGSTARVENTSHFFFHMGQREDVTGSP